MAVLVNESIRAICQGLTGSLGRFRSEQTIACGPTMVGGVTFGTGVARIGGDRMRRSRAILALVLTLGPAVPASAQASADLIAGLEAGLETCILHYGDSDALRTSFVNAGWKIASQRPFLRYRAAKHNLLAGHSRPKDKATFCMVSAKNLTMDQAGTITAATVKRLKGFSPHPTEERTWVGRLNGQETWLGFSISLPTPSFDAPVIAFTNPPE